MRELDLRWKAGEQLSSPEGDAWREWKSVSLGLPLKEERMSKRKRKKRKKRKIPKSSSARAPRAWKPGQYSSSSLVSVCHSFGVRLAREVQENCWFLGDDFLDISYEPLVFFGSHSFSVCLARSIQENWNYLGYDLFLRPLVSGSHLIGVCMWSPGIGLFWVKTSGNAVFSACSHLSTLCASPGGRCPSCAGRVPARCCA